MPKNKTHSGMKKRVKRTGTGKLVTQRAGMRHNLEHKPSKKTRALNAPRVVSEADVPRIKRMLGI